MMNRILYDATDDFLDNEKGIFYYINTLENKPDFMGDFDYHDCDYDYLLNHSGNKLISPIVDKLLSNQAESLVLSDASYTKLAKIIVTKYIAGWNKAYDAITAEYNPIHNYDMTEEGSDTLTKTGTETHGGSDTLTKTGTESHSGSDTLTKSGSEKSETDGDHDIYGFNSSGASHADKTSTDTTLSFTNRQDAHALSDTLSFTNRQDAHTLSDTLSFTNRQDANAHSLTRSGNIGVTTSAQMVSQELELRRESFINRVYADIDKVLTLAIY